jgi:hypothetical protein
MPKKQAILQIFLVDFGNHSELRKKHYKGTKLPIAQLEKRCFCSARCFFQGLRGF